MTIAQVWVEAGGGYSGFQVTGMLEWGQQSKPKRIPKAINPPPPTKKNPWGFQQNPQKIHGQKLNTKKSHAVLPSLKNFQKTLNGVTCTVFGSTIFAELRGRDARALPQIFKLFWIPPKNPYLNPATATPKNTCPIFLPKKIAESKISNPKMSFDHPRHLKSELPDHPRRLPLPWEQTGRLHFSPSLVYWRLTLSWNKS